LISKILSHIANRLPQGRGSDDSGAFRQRSGDTLANF
jgi:hypothetical protein